MVTWGTPTLGNPQVSIWTGNTCDESANWWFSGFLHFTDKLSEIQQQKYSVYQTDQGSHQQKSICNGWFRFQLPHSMTLPTKNHGHFRNLNLKYLPYKRSKRTCPNKYTTSIWGSGNSQWKQVHQPDDMCCLSWFCLLLTWCSPINLNSQSRVHVS